MKPIHIVGASALALAALAGPARADELFSVFVDTSSIAAQGGFIEFGLNPGPGSAAAAAAAVGNFSASGLSFTAPPDRFGAVLGTLPAALSFSASAADNRVTHPVQFGTGFSFELGFTQPLASGWSAAFFLSLLDSSFMPLVTVDPNGSALTVQLAAGESIRIDRFDADSSGTPSVVTIAAIPEPSLVVTLALGLMVIGLVLARRQATVI